MSKTILHCDINNFYASVEICKNPKLKGKTVAVCGDPSKRHGIILAKSNEAKKYGVKTADVIWEAQAKCPHLILLPADYESYVKYSDIVYEIYTRYTDRVESYGMDECWLDVTGCTRLFGDGKTIADELRRVIKEETGLTVSVGVSFTKIFAKLGSDMKKPDATTVIDENDYKRKTWHLPVESLIMVGKKTKVKLNKYNIYSIGDLARADRELLHKALGIVGVNLINCANGVDDSDVRYYWDKFIPKSVGHSSTTPRDMVSLSEIKSLVYALSDQIGYRLRKLGLASQGVSVQVKFNDFQSMIRQNMLDYVTNSGADIAKASMKIIKEQIYVDKPIRAVGISTYNLVDIGKQSQCSFFDREIEKKSSLDKSLDKIKEKYGVKSIKRGAELEYQELTDIFDDVEFLPFKK